LLPLVLLLGVGLAIAFVGVGWFVWHRLRHPPRKTYASAVARSLPGEPGELDEPRAFEAYELDLGGPGPSPVWSIVGDDPSGPVVIATPGWGDSRVGMLVRLGVGAAPGLATSARRVLAWDPPGQGEARGRCSLGADEPRMIGKLIAHAREIEPGAPVVLFGSSLGGGASIVAASMHDGGDAVRSVIAEAPYRLPVTPARNVIGLSGYPTFVLAPVYWLLGAVLAGRPGVRWPGAHSGRGFDRAAHAADLRCPLLVLHGTDDQVSPIEDGRAIAQAAPEGSIAAVEGAGHNDLWTVPMFASAAGEACAAFVARAGGEAAGDRPAPAGTMRA
jgi:pimeloyl-ACP methyl ester carboxylesterase